PRSPGAWPGGHRPWAILATAGRSDPSEPAGVEPCFTAGAVAGGREPVGQAGKVVGAPDEDDVALPQGLGGALEGPTVPLADHDPAHPPVPGPQRAQRLEETAVAELEADGDPDGRSEA